MIDSEASNTICSHKEEFLQEVLLIFAEKATQKCELLEDRQSGHFVPVWMLTLLGLFGPLLPGEATQGLCGHLEAEEGECCGRDVEEADEDVEGEYAVLDHLTTIILSYWLY